MRSGPRCQGWPKSPNAEIDVSKRILLNNLPKLLAGYGKSWYEGYPAVVFVVCDLDDKCLKSFRQELTDVLNSCEPRPETRFCFAIEEGEAWLLGDITAIKKAYPKAKNSVLNAYINDDTHSGQFRLRPTLQELHSIFLW